MPEKQKATTGLFLLFYLKFKLILLGLDPKTRPLMRQTPQVVCAAPLGSFSGIGAVRSDRISSHMDQVARPAFFGFLCQ